MMTVEHTQTTLALQTREAVKVVAFSPDGKHLAYASAKRVTVLLREETAPVMSYTHRGVVTTLAWSPAGARLASGASDATIQVWQPETGVKGSTCVYLPPRATRGRSLKRSPGPPMACTWRRHAATQASTCGSPLLDGGGRCFLDTIGNHS